MKKRLLFALLIAIAAMLALAGCGGASSSGGKGGNVTIGVTNMIDKIDPTDGGDPWSITSDGISETIYMQNKDGELVSHLADDIKMNQDGTWTLTLKDGVKFSDGSAVDAKAVADCMNEIMKKNENAQASAGVIEFTAKDDKTLTLKPERKTTVMKSILCEWTNVIYKKDGDNYVFTGPYKVKSLEGGSKLELEPNQYYDDNASKRPNVTLKCFKDTSSMQTAFESGEIDMAFTITAEMAKDLQNKGHTVNNFDAGYQYFAMVNTANGALKDAKVREAVNEAIDRDAMVKSLQGGRVANGFFAQYYSFAGNVEEKFNADDAKAKLAEAGYKDTDGDKYLDKDGKPLTIKIATYSYRPDLPVIAQLAVSDLDKIGIKAETSIEDNIDDYAAEKKYDLIFYAQHTAPTGEPAYALNMFFRSDGSKNTMGYSDKSIDAKLDELGKMEVGSERDELAKTIQSDVQKGMPVMYLIDPEWHIAVSDKLKDYKPYCGDYYIVNPELGL
ncbi:MAG: ABC transporter substrate-binding protein [Eubacteriaceae bacterium]|nr:ABC transporter substrate-binding protein [Eubacteriaceae bacterium]